MESCYVSQDLGCRWCHLSSGGCQFSPFVCWNDSFNFRPFRKCLDDQGLFLSRLSVRSLVIGPVHGGVDKSQDLIYGFVDVDVSWRRPHVRKRSSFSQATVGHRRLSRMAKSGYLLKDIHADLEMTSGSTCPNKHAVGDVKVGVILESDAQAFNFIEHLVHLSDSRGDSLDDIKSSSERVSDWRVLSGGFVCHDDGDLYSDVVDECCE